MRGDQIVLQVERKGSPEQAEPTGGMGEGLSIETPAEKFRAGIAEWLGAGMAIAAGIPSQGPASAMSGGGTASGMSSGGGGGGPGSVYDGKSYYAWLQVMETERSPTRLLEAVNAIALLAPETHSEQAASSLLRIMLRVRVSDN